MAGVKWRYRWNKMNLGIMSVGVVDGKVDMSWRWWRIEETCGRPRSSRIVQRPFLGHRRRKALRKDGLGHVVNRS